MKRGSMIGLIFIMVVSLIMPQAALAKDYGSHWAKYDIEALSESGIMGGYPDGTFKPDRQITRAEFTKLLLGALDIAATDSSSPFTDVKKSDWFHSVVVTAHREGLVGGITPTKFSPNSNITREQMAAMIQRALEKKGVTSRESEIKFADESRIGAWAKPSVKRLYFLGIINGLDNKINFGPKNNATRAQTAAIIVRMLNVMDNPKVVIGHTNYGYDFKKMVDGQMTGTPKVDGAGIYIASRAMVEYYANPNNFDRGSSDFMQFLILSERSGVSAKMINDKFLKGRGILDGQANAFLEAGKKYNVNEIYLIAHALHETGNGTSKLAQGIEVGIGPDGKPAMVTADNRDSLKNIKTTYNMYGVGAIDSCPNECGSIHAYEQGWYTPAAAVIGGAEFISRYILRGQDTLYKMRWNPENPGGYPQYATHVMWATLQAQRIQNMYNEINGYTLKFDVPKFANNPGKTKKPEGVAQYHVDTKLAGEKGKVVVTDTPLRMRTGPTTSFSEITTLANDTEVTVIGANGGWYKVEAAGKTGWVSGAYILLDKDVKASGTVEVEDGVSAEAEAEADVKAEEGDGAGGDGAGGDGNAGAEAPAIGAQAKIIVNDVPFRSSPAYADNVIRELNSGTEAMITDVIDGWYEVDINGESGWVSNEFVSLE